MKKLQARLSSLHAECQALIELVRLNTSAEEADYSEADRAKRAFERVHKTYKDLARDKIQAQLTALGEDAESYEELSALRREHLTKLSLIDSAWSAVVETEERRRLFEMAEQRMGRRTTKQSADQMIQDSKRRLLAELSRMENVEEGLVTISENIRGAGSLFGIYDREVKQARKLFSTMMTNAEKDERYMQWAFYFLMGVCVYILAKRFGILRLIYLLMWLTQMALAHIIRLVTNVVGVWVDQEGYELWPMRIGSRTTIHMVKEGLLGGDADPVAVPTVITSQLLSDEL